MCSELDLAGAKQRLKRGDTLTGNIENVRIASSRQLTAFPVSVASVLGNKLSSLQSFIILHLCFFCRFHYFMKLPLLIAIVLTGDTLIHICANNSRRCIVNPPHCAESRKFNCSQAFI